MLYWPFYFKNWIPVNCIFSLCKWTYILDLGPWRWIAFNMGHMDKWPSRMQGQFYFSKSGGAGREHGLHPGSERGVPGAKSNPGQMWSSPGHGTIALIWCVSNTWWFSRRIDDILVSHLCKSQTTPTILIMRSVIHRAMTRLVFVPKVGKLGCGMWLWGADQLELWVFYNEIIIWQNFILHATTLETWHNQY